MNRPFTIGFKARDFSSVMDPGNLKFVVNSYSHQAIGGCAEASITVYGGDLGLEDTINWLRRPVTIYDGMGVAVWWGYVHQVQLRKDALEIAPSLDSMVNRVAVTYSYVEPGSQKVGVRKTTPWADDLNSQAEYGIRELMSSDDGSSDASALARRSAILAGQAWPYGGLSQFGSPRGAVRYSGAKKSASATLICRGWWGTLAWKYASIAVPTAGTLPAITDTPDAYQGIGIDASHAQSLQAFTPVQSVQATTLAIWLKITGSPADSLNIDIDAATAPAGWPSGTHLTTITVAAASLTTSLVQYTLTLPAAVQLGGGLGYDIVLRRSGAADASNYYSCGIKAGGGHDVGYFWNWNGSAWVQRAGDDDMPFALGANNAAESTHQIADIVTKCGQFLTATDIEALSGVVLPSYLNGDKDGLTAILKLLESGGANGRRLLASVDSERRVVVWEEPAASTAAYYLNSRAQLYGAGGVEISEYSPPVGVWVRLKDVLSGVVDLSKITDPSLQFIEGSSWSADNGAQYTFRGQPSVESLLSVGG